MALKLSTGELAAAKAAAAKEGLGVTAWIGKVVEAAADPASPMAEQRATRAEIDVVAQATHKVKKVGYLLNQAVTAFHTTGEPPAELARITRLTWRVVARLEDEVIELRQKRQR